MQTGCKRSRKIIRRVQEHDQLSRSGFVQQVLYDRGRRRHHTTTITPHPVCEKGCRIGGVSEKGASEVYRTPGRVQPLGGLERCEFFGREQRDPKLAEDGIDVVHCHGGGRREF